MNKVRIKGEDTNIRLTDSSGLFSSYFFMEVAFGLVPGYSAVNKFGHNPLTASTGGIGVWSGLGAYKFYPTVAKTMEILSASGGDTGAGIGARTVYVEGLDNNLDPITEIATMNGTTPVTLTNTYKRMNRAAAVTAGSYETNIGNISMRIQAATTVGAFIRANDGQTQQAMYTVPHGKSALFVKGYVGMMHNDKNGVDATFQWQARSNNGVNGAWQTKGQMGLINIGNSHWQYEYGIPAGIIPEKTDIRILVTTASKIIDSVGGYDLILRDNSLDD